jgi:valyl-tRNA synthetase
MLWWFYFAGAVVEAFVRLHDKGLIYQGRIIYYSCPTTKERESVCVHDLEQIFVLSVVYFFFQLLYFPLF